MLGEKILLEGVVTTAGEDGAINVAPMGPIVDRPITRLLLRPFQGSATFANLARERRGVLNITDDVGLIARAALNQLESPPQLAETPSGASYLADGCRWFAFEVESIDDRRPRSEMDCRVSERGVLRDFIGFNRAMHAVLEATILATRLHLTGREAALGEIDRYASAVEKTGGDRERRAFEFVRGYVDRWRG